MSKPSLHEIVEMPYFGQALKAIREHYDPLWGMSRGDGPTKYEVSVEYSYRETEFVTYEVEADTPEAAIKAAKKRFGDDPNLEHSAEWESASVDVIDD